MTSLPQYELFPDPVREGVFESSTLACGICSREQGIIYTGPQFSPSATTDGLRICPWCIADGSAGSRGITFNNSTIYPWSASTPQMTADDKDLVERRTPGFDPRQNQHWLMCCGRACIYLGEAEAADLRGRWSSAVPSMFEGEGRDQQEMDEIVSTVGRESGVGAYVFRCQICGSHKAFWDCY